MSDQPEDKKIIIDEDWKSRAQAEKEELERKRQEKQPEAAGSERGREDVGEMPPASFNMLVTTLATEAMVALGQIPHPATGKAEMHPAAARYFIDTLEILQEKTKGNLNQDEAQGLEGVLHQLRLAFVAARRPASPQKPE